MIKQRPETSRTFTPPKDGFIRPAHGAPPRDRTYVLGPVQLLLGALTCIVATLVVAGSVGIFVMSGEPVETAAENHDQIVLQYEDHIDRLRAEIERLNSRQIVDRETVEIQVMDVLRRQQDLNQRHSIVADLVARAESVGIYLNSDKPVPSQKPAIDARGLASLNQDDASAIGGESEIINEPVKALGLRETGPGQFDPLTVLQRTEAENSTEIVKKNTEKQAALTSIKVHISQMGTESTAAVDAITIATESRINDILDVTRKVIPGIDSAVLKNTPIGGPFLPVTEANFDIRLDRANTALKTLRRLKFAALRLPVKRPVRNARVSSGYGPRMDPFLSRLAMHTGMDFKASYGAQVFATAPGTVISARWHGGYGKMVEIHHANGFVTRYAHLSRMRVKEGDHVIAGDLIGNIGSTGRSTGPHLHYEVRRNNKPSDPAIYLKAGDKLAGLSL